MYGRRSLSRAQTSRCVRRAFGSADDAWLPSLCYYKNFHSGARPSLLPHTFISSKHQISAQADLINDSGDRPAFPCASTSHYGSLSPSSSSLFITPNVGSRFHQNSTPASSSLLYYLKFPRKFESPPGNPTVGLGTEIVFNGAAENFDHSGG